MLLSDNSYAREQELIIAEKNLVGVRIGIELLTQKVIIIENLILDGNKNSAIISRVEILNNKLKRLKGKILEDIDRILFISSSRHNATGPDVDYINSLEKQYILNYNFDKLLAIRLVTIFENSILIAGKHFDRYDINPEDYSKVLSLGFSLIIGK